MFNASFLNSAVSSLIANKLYFSSGKLLSISTGGRGGGRITSAIPYKNSSTYTISETKRHVRRNHISPRNIQSLKNQNNIGQYCTAGTHWLIKNYDRRTWVDFSNTSLIMLRVVRESHRKALIRCPGEPEEESRRHIYYE